MPRAGEHTGEPGLDDDTVATFEQLDSSRHADALALVVMSPSFSMTYPLPPTGEVTIGRARSAEIFLDDMSVSRAHAVVTAGPKLSVRDLGSANGTRVGGVRLVADVTHPLRVGDAITVGAATMLVQPAAVVAAAQVAALERPTMSPPGRRIACVDPRMAELMAFVKLIAAGDLAVLIVGETGVGKEIIAEEMHRLSPRSHGPFVRLNCGALSEPLLESELFGHEKGAFTSAEKSKLGLLETAAGGTVFLDEIGELPLTMQVKLLRVLEDKQVTRVGGLKPRTLDVRFVGATNRDLDQQVRGGQFREDLYYRIAGATVSVPPLRERIADIEPLARLVLDNVAERIGKRIGITQPTLELLRRYAWPGNVRELRNVIERAALICGDGPLVPAHLPASVHATQAPDTRPTHSIVRARSTSTQPPFNESADAARIMEVLASCGGNQSRAAKELGLSRAALIRRIDKLGVVRPRKPAS
ncbi:hypothetical protein BH11MYX2_BH11MYX2_12780 [soil metagenome]